MNQLIFDFAAHDYPSFDKFLGTENAELVYVLRHKHGQFIYVWGEEVERCRLKPFSDGIVQIGKARENNVQ